MSTSQTEEPTADALLLAAYKERCEVLQRAIGIIACNLSAGLANEITASALEEGGEAPVTEGSYVNLIAMIHTAAYLAGEKEIVRVARDQILSIKGPAGLAMVDHLLSDHVKTASCDHVAHRIDEYEGGEKGEGE